MKLRRLITRRRVKWAGMVLSVLVLITYIGSIWLSADVFRFTNSSFTSVGIRSGRLAVMRRYCSDGPIFGGTSIHSIFKRRQPRFYLWCDWAIRENTNLSTGWVIHVTAIWIPLWLPLLLIATPTAYFWYTDRRAKPWQCPKCRYDLRGLDGGVCPECGTPIAEPAK